jgi:hypothetical protein
MQAVTFPESSHQVELMGRSLARKAYFTKVPSCAWSCNILDSFIVILDARHFERSTDDIIRE